VRLKMVSAYRQGECLKYDALTVSGPAARRARAAESEGQIHEMADLIRTARKVNPDADYETLAGLIELGKHEIRRRVDEDAAPRGRSIVSGGLPPGLATGRRPGQTRISS
jgi:hypothetical protein